MSLKMKNVVAELSRKRCWLQSEASQGSNGHCFQVIREDFRKEDLEWLFVPGFHPSSGPVTCSWPKTGRDRSLMENCISLHLK